jgi:hypothetical protein
MMANFHKIGMAAPDEGESTIRKSRLASGLSLFTSSGTLICCALPALLVAIGAGAAMSSLIANVPQLVWFSEHKLEVFMFAAIMLMVSGYLQWQARFMPCPTEPELAAKCMSTRKMSLRVYWVSLAIFFVGGFFAFIAPILL